MTEPVVPPATAPFVEARRVGRAYGPVVALDGADLSLARGEVHALVGENGAGKSTLVGVLGGFVRPDSGSLRVDGAPVRFRSPRDAVAASIGVVHQHFKLVPALTGLENVALWAPGTRGLGARLDLPAIREAAEATMERAGFRIDLDRPAGQLSVGARQRLEVLKLLYRDPTVLILDEPTAVLAPPEVDALLATLRRLAADGRAILVVAHKLDEVLAVADRVTVLRGGRSVLSAERSAVDADRLARAIVGHAPDPPTRRSPVAPGTVVAALRNVVVEGPGGEPRLRGIDLEVRRGEIVGIAGVEGNGQYELARVLVGLDAPTSGEVQRPDPVAYVPPDRSTEGLVPDFDLAENVALALADGPRHRSSLGRIDWPSIQERTRSLIARHEVVAPGPSTRARELSGGNQQKLVVGRELARESALVVVDNPTRGLDLASTGFVRRELACLREGAPPGVALGGEGDHGVERGPSDERPGVVLVSADLDEVMELADRLFVIVRGRLSEVPPGRRTRDAVGTMMLGG